MLMNNSKFNREMTIAQEPDKGFTICEEINLQKRGNDVRPRIFLLGKTLLHFNIAFKEFMSKIFVILMYRATYPVLFCVSWSDLVVIIVYCHTFMNQSDHLAISGIS